MEIQARKGEVERLIQDMKSANLESLTISPPEETRAFLDGNKIYQVYMVHFVKTILLFYLRASKITAKPYFFRSREQFNFFFVVVTRKYCNIFIGAK